MRTQAAMAETSKFERHQYTAPPASTLAAPFPDDRPPIAFGMHPWTSRDGHKMVGHQPMIASISAKVRPLVSRTAT